jgi:hypothetical protein
VAHRRLHGLQVLRLFEVRIRLYRNFLQALAKIDFCGRIVLIMRHIVGIHYINAKEREVA